MNYIRPLRDLSLPFKCDLCGNELMFTCYKCGGGILTVDKEQVTTFFGINEGVTNENII